MAYNLFPESDALLIAPRVQPRPVAESFDLLGAIGSGVASGFKVASDVLDTPFAFGRDLLSGRNPLPGLIDPDVRTTTREFFGIEEAPGPWDEIADVGLSILFDPVTYATLGASALGKSGTVLRKAGLLDDLVKVGSQKAGREMGKRAARMTVTPNEILGALDPALHGRAMDRARDAAKGLGMDFDQLLAREGDRPVGGLIGAGLPLVGERFNFGAYGTGSLAQKIAGGMDRGADLLRWSPPGRAAAQLFDKTSGGHFNETAQRAAQELWQRREEARVASRERSYQVLKRYDDLRSSGNVNVDELDDVLAFAVERKSGVPVSPAVQPVESVYNNLPQAVRVAVDDVVGLMRGETGSVKQQFDDIGLRLPELFDEFVEYAPRYVSDFYRRQGEKRALFDTYFSSQEARESILRNIPNGRSALNKMMSDPQLVGPAKSPNAALIIESLYGVADPQQATDLAGFLGRMPDEALGETLYGNPIENVMRYMEGGIETAKTASYLQEYLAPFAKHATAAATPGGGASVPTMITQKMRAELKAAGYSADDIAKMRPAEAWEALGKYKKTETVESVLRKAGFTQGGSWQIDPAGNRVYVEGSQAVHPAAAARMAQLIGVASPDDALKMVLPEDVATFVTKTMEPFTKPASSIPIVQATDYFLNTFKGLATGPFIAFHGRNFGSGVVRNAQLGAFNPADTKRIDGLLRSGKAIPGVHEIPAIKRILNERGLPATAEEGTEIFKELSYVHEISGGHVATPADVAASPAEAFASAVPGRRQFSYKDAAKAYFQRKRAAWNPFAVRGGYDPFAGSKIPFKAGAPVEASTFGPAQAGEMLGEHVEALNRNQAFLTLLRKGDSPGVAAAKVSAAHGRYDSRNFTKAENEVFRRLFPFFKFSANQTRWLVSELMERPGGRLAKTIRAVAATQQQDPFAPDYIKRGASIPLPPGPSGEPRYLAGLGIMEEDPLSFFGGGGSMEVLSRLNPLIKGPMEAALNQSFFQVGRPMNTLDPPLGRTIGNLMGEDQPVNWLGSATRPAEQILSNIVPRPFTTLRTLTDPRKELPVRLMNTTTGLRVVDIPEAARDQVVRQIAQDLLEQFPDTKRRVTTYIPTEDLAAMPPAAREEAQRLLDVLKHLDRRGKERKQARDAELLAAP